MNSDLRAELCAEMRQLPRHVRRQSMMIDVDARLFHRVSIMMLTQNSFTGYSVEDVRTCMYVHPGYKVQSTSFPFLLPGWLAEIPENVISPAIKSRDENDRDCVVRYFSILPIFPSFSPLSIFDEGKEHPRGNGVYELVK